MGHEVEETPSYEMTKKEKEAWDHFIQLNNEKISLTEQLEDLEFYKEVQEQRSVTAKERIEEYRIDITKRLTDESIKKQATAVVDLIESQLEENQRILDEEDEDMDTSEPGKYNPMSFLESEVEETSSYEMSKKEKEAWDHFIQLSNEKISLTEQLEDLEFYKEVQEQRSVTAKERIEEYRIDITKRLTDESIKKQATAVVDLIESQLEENQTILDEEDKNMENTGESYPLTLDQFFEYQNTNLSLREQLDDLKFYKEVQEKRSVITKEQIEEYRNNIAIRLKDVNVEKQAIEVINILESQLTENKKIQEKNYTELTKEDTGEIDSMLSLETEFLEMPHFEITEEIKEAMEKLAKFNRDNRGYEENENTESTINNSGSISYFKDSEGLNKLKSSVSENLKDIDTENHDENTELVTYSLFKVIFDKISKRIIPKIHNKKNI